MCDREPVHSHHRTRASLGRNRPHHRSKCDTWEGRAAQSRHARPVAGASPAAAAHHTACRPPRCCFHRHNAASPWACSRSGWRVRLLQAGESRGGRDGAWCAINVPHCVLLSAAQSKDLLSFRAAMPLLENSRSFDFAQDDGGRGSLRMPTFLSTQTKGPPAVCRWAFLVPQAAYLYRLTVPAPYSSCTRLQQLSLRPQKQARSAAAVALRSA